MVDIVVLVLFVRDCDGLLTLAISDDDSQLIPKKINLSQSRCENTYLSMTSVLY
jgi:hypothetical protein